MTHNLKRYLQKTLSGFFILIFIMGFFARSLMTYTLPNVKVQKISSGTEVTATSEEWGNIVAKHSEHYLLNDDVIIADVYVKKGSYVKKGTPLFKIRSASINPDQSQAILKSKSDLLINSIEQEREALLAAHKLQFEALTRTLKLAEEQLTHQSKLWLSGAITKDELTEATRIRDDAKTALTKENSDYKRQCDALVIKAEENHIEQQLIQNKLEALRHATSQIKINANQVVTATGEGYMTAVPEEGKHYAAGETLGTLGLCHSYKDLCFELKMSQRTFYQASESAAPLALTSEDGLKIGLVNFDYPHAAFQDGEMVVQGNFTQEPDIWVFPGQQVVSRTAFSRYIQDEVMAIPRSAIVNRGNSLEGSGNLIYLIRKDVDALGESTVAVATPVEVVSNTDDYAIVKDLDFMPSDQVIINPNARIKDGTKVYICE